MMNPPAISVIIPLYNAEKYFGECLESLLAQTFKDFEVIVVNDCSTDGSHKVAESYLEKFDGRLNIFDNRQNSGVSVSRNKGLKISRGEYIFFMDADDLLLPDSLERMYRLAKSFDVDVVNCTGTFSINDDGSEWAFRRLKRPTATDENIFETNLEWRVKGLLKDNFYLSPWRKFSRRDFLIRNGLFFPEKTNNYEDQIWSFGLLLCSEKILHTPLAAYVYRKSYDSLSRKKYAPLQNVNIFLNVIFQGLKWIDNIMDRMPFFETNPKYRYLLLAHFSRRYFTMLYKSNFEVSTNEIYQSIKEVFGKNFGKYDVLIPVLCTLISSYWKDIEENKVRIAALKKQLS